MKELEQKALQQLASQAKSFLYKGVSHAASRNGSTIEIYTFGRGSSRLVHFFTPEITKDEN